MHFSSRLFLGFAGTIGFFSGIADYLATAARVALIPSSGDHIDFAGGFEKPRFEMADVDRHHPRFLNWLRRILVAIRSRRYSRNGHHHLDMSPEAAI